MKLDIRKDLYASEVPGDRGKESATQNQAASWVWWHRCGTLVTHKAEAKEIKNVRTTWATEGFKAHLGNLVRPFTK